MKVINLNDHSHDHCWHAYCGPIWMVIPDGHTVQKCCKCPAMRTIHVDHVQRRVGQLEEQVKR